MCIRYDRLVDVCRVWLRKRRGKFVYILYEMKLLIYLSFFQSLFVHFVKLNQKSLIGNWQLVPNRSTSKNERMNGRIVTAIVWLVVW